MSTAKRRYGFAASNAVGALRPVAPSARFPRVSRSGTWSPYGALVVREHGGMANEADKGGAGGVACGRGGATDGRCPGGVTFYSMRDGNAEIYTMDWDGGHQTRVTDHPATDVDPAISPNGRDIVFTSNRDGNNDIFVVDSRGWSPVNLTNDPANDGMGPMVAEWTPGGLSQQS